MAVVVQNDDGDEAGANSYLSVADFKTYHGARGNDYSAYSDTLIGNALVRATDYIDARFRFRGVQILSTQTTQWPRQAGNLRLVMWIDITPTLISETGEFLLDANGFEIIGLPTALKNATAEYAFRALTILLFQDAPAPEGGRLIDSITQTVDVITQSIKYTSPQSGAFVMPAFPAADLMLVRAGLVAAGRLLER